MSASSVRRILSLHAGRYPELELRDAIRLLYESEFGTPPLADLHAETEALKKELAQARETHRTPPYIVEAIGDGSGRFHLDPERFSEEDCSLLALCMAAERRETGSMAGLWEKLGLLAGLARSHAGPDVGSQTEESIFRWASEGCCLPDHSEAYANAYHPHYRVIDRHLAAWFPALQMIHRALETGDGPVVVAVDGRCASGKTVFARHLRRLWPCNLFHMDDYALPSDQKTPQRMALPGGGTDYERAEEELFLPLTRGESVTVRPFDGRRQSMGEPVTVPPCRLNIVEGSCALHPRLAPYSQVRLLFTCDPSVQLDRLARREDPASLADFMENRLPLEEAYLSTLNVNTSCDAVIDTSRLPYLD